MENNFPPYLAGRTFGLKGQAKRDAIHGVIMELALIDVSAYYDTIKYLQAYRDRIER